MTHQLCDLEDYTSKGGGWILEEKGPIQRRLKSNREFAAENELRVADEGKYISESKKLEVVKGNCY